MQSATLASMERSPSARTLTIYSLVFTCGLLGIEPWAYLKDVLQRIAEGAHPTTLTPRLWKAARTQAAPH